MRVLISTLALLLIGVVAPPAHAQLHPTPSRLCLSADGSCPEASPGRFPIGTAAEDWSWRYASGRSNLSTLVPLAVGGVLLRVHRAASSDASLGDPLAITGLGLIGTGLVIGPSVGEWCLGGDCARRSWLPMGVRAAGAAEIAGAMVWLDRKIDQSEGLGGISLIALTPLLVLPGVVLIALGGRWSFQHAARVRCGTGDGSAHLSVTPAVTPHLDGGGLSVRLRW